MAETPLASLKALARELRSMGIDFAFAEGSNVSLDIPCAARSSATRIGGARLGFRCWRRIPFEYSALV